MPARRCRPHHWDAMAGRTAAGVAPRSAPPKPPDDPSDEIEVYARPWTSRGNAADYIRQFDPDDVEPGQRFVLWCRVSGRAQGAERNFLGHEAGLRAAVESAGGVVAEVFAFAGKGRGPGHLRRLRRAADRARELGAILL